MQHIDLFSGIGGFSLAVDSVWDDVEHIFCEINPFCQKILKKHWSNSLIHDDIKTLKNTGCEQPFILTGGFPCQPFSQAGLRRGTSDDRFLWNEMLRVIQEFSPTWVIAENVRGLITIEQGMVLKQVCLDLEASGYEVQPLIIPAVAVGAPHRRDRVWFIAHRTDKLGERSEQKRSGGGQPEATTGNGNSNVADTEQQRPVQSKLEERPRPEKGVFESGAKWNKNWIEVATELCGVDDGLPVELDGFKLSKSRHRAEQLKAYGNAIVPQVAIEIMQSIKLSEKYAHYPSN